jgi:hypothetical protein
VPSYTQPLNTLPVTNVYHDANNETLYGGRLSLLYKPSEDFSILGEAMTQSLHTGGYDLLDGTPTSAEPSHRSTARTTRPSPCAKGFAMTSRSSASPSRQTWALRT